jgi:hypothetical protein
MIIVKKEFNVSFKARNLETHIFFINNPLYTAGLSRILFISFTVCQTFIYNIHKNYPIFACKQNSDHLSFNMRNYADNQTAPEFNR